MATHFSILVWEIPWTEELGRLQSMGFQSRTWLSTRIYTETCIHEFTCTFMSILVSVYLLCIWKPWVYFMSPIPVQHHKVYSDFLSFNIYKYVLLHWENWLLYPKMLTYFISLTCSLSHPLPYMDALPTLFGSQYSISSLLPHPQEGYWDYYVIKNLCKVISYILSGICLGTIFYRAYVVMKRNCSQLRVTNLSSYSLFFFFPPKPMASTALSGIHGRFIWLLFLSFIPKWIYFGK